jgi:hypothetical protein
VQIRPIRAGEYEETGRVIVAAYEAIPGGHMTDDYAEELSAVARRAAGAEVLVAVTDHVLGSVTFVPDASSPWAELLEDVRQEKAEAPLAASVVTWTEARSGVPGNMTGLTASIQTSAMT